MSDEWPGPSSLIQLVPAERKLNLNLFICQKIKDSSGSSKLTSTSEGRNVLLKTSQSLNDELMNNLSDHDLEKIQYHDVLHTKERVKEMSRKNQNLKEHQKNPLTHFCRVLKIAKNGQKFLLQRALKKNLALSAIKWNARVMQKDIE